MISMLLLALLAQDAPTDKDAEAALKRLKETFAKASIEGRIAAIGEALQCRHEKVIKAVGEALTSEADSVRIPAAQALGEADHPASASVLAASLGPNLRRADVARAIIEALGTLGWQSGAGVLHDLVKKVGDDDARAVLPAAFETLAQLGSPASIDPLIDLLEKMQGPKRSPWPGEGDIRRGAEKALRAVTGVEFARAQDWASWWRGNQEILKGRATRTFWMKKTQDRIEVGPAEKAPADSVLVATRIAPPIAAAQGKQKKKK